MTQMFIPYGDCFSLVFHYGFMLLAFLVGDRPLPYDYSLVIAQY